MFRLGTTKEDCRQVYISNNFKKDHKVTIINLGLLIEGENSHYVLIKHLSRLYTKGKHIESHICYNCMNGFSSEQARDNHFDDCIRNKAGNTIMPTGKNRFVEFKKYINKIPCPIVIYCDFEAISVEIKRIIEQYKERSNIDENGNEVKIIFTTQKEQ